MTAHAAHAQPTKLALARELVARVAQWTAGRVVYLVVDSAYASRPLLEQRPPHVHLLSRLRADAALWARPGRRRPGQKGRPRRRGARLPKSPTLAAHRRHWDALPLPLYGRPVCPQVFTLTALWYHALRDQPLRIVVVRDPTGKRRDEAFCCTDLTVDAAFMLAGYARRWTIEVAFHDQKQFLGFAEPQCQTPRAVQRTAPFALLVYDLVLLWFAEHAPATTGPTWAVRPWHRHKTAPSFADMLTALRGALGLPRFLEPLRPGRRPANSPASAPDGECQAA